MPYHRVLPRDLFNEAKLLKCLGRLSLHVHDYEGRWPLSIEHQDPESGFIIDQNPDDGGLFCVNLNLVCDDGRRIDVYSSYNSKEAYSLNFVDQDGCHDRVFDDEGEFTREFVGFVSRHEE